MASRRLRAFKRWMTSNGIQFSDALEFLDTESAGICVKSKSELKEGDLIATIPKNACLTIRTSSASPIIEDADFDGCLGLCVAVMYERSLGSNSNWDGYLQLLPKFEPLPLVWSLDDIDRLLSGTELHKTMKEDKALVYEDWKECILPLIHSEKFVIDSRFFGVEDYFAAKSLIASRSFQIDDYHGAGMVPLADLFNHKTGAEDVHFTTSSSPDESDDSVSSVTDDDEIDSSDKISSGKSLFKENGLSGTSVVQSSSDGPKLDSEETPDNPLVLEMILVKDVKAGSEVFNTYGYVGNAALLHRYGFTELDNPFDIINIDLELVLQWSSSLFSGRHSRARLSLWRKLGYSGCESQNSEYFEISYEGEPQLELLILLYIVLLPEETYTKLDLTLASKGNPSESDHSNTSKAGKILQGKISEMSTDMLLTKSVRKALMSLADIREGLYGTSSLEHDMESLSKCDCSIDRKLYHSLVLRVSERRIIQKLRNYAEAGAKSLSKAPRPHLRKKLKS
ncbi:ribosomal lysine N-methyltransferase 3-like isoform X1 [Chenopodium quinoa]|uniref:N-lysine methyltransferase n=1 Tax=Chenopodium quinoa TaxID=63459 RepID=A0A803L513_CHEQI|nr:ribosomal lysine N-methyltransferase 3-like isoform X1 [Chenopodium quinoa]